MSSGRSVSAKSSRELGSGKTSISSLTDDGSGQKSKKSKHVSMQVDPNCVDSDDDEIVQQPQRSASTKSSKSKTYVGSATSVNVLGLSTKPNTSILKNIAGARDKIIYSSDEDEDAVKDDTLQWLGPKSYVKFYNDRKARTDVKDPLNVIGYARVSRDVKEKDEKVDEKKGADENRSVKGQMLQIEQKCQRLGHNLVFICVDSGISGAEKRRKRPGFNYVFSASQPGDVLMMVDLSRLSREVEDSAKYRRQLKLKKVKLDSFDVAYDDSTAEGEMMIDFYTAMAKAYRKSVSKKIANAAEARAVANKSMRKATYGKRWDKEKGELVENPTEQRGIQDIRKFVEQYPTITIPQLVEVLNDPNCTIPPHRRKPKPGQKGWYYAAVKNLLIREGIREGKPPVKLTDDVKNQRDQVIKVKHQENLALLQKIEDIAKSSPGLTCTQIARELVDRGINLVGSKRLIDDSLVRRILDIAGLEVSMQDDNAELRAASVIRQLKATEPKIKVAEIIRRLTALDLPPLLRASSWNYYTINKLIKKYNISDVPQVVEESYKDPTYVKGMVVDLQEQRKQTKAATNAAKLEKAGQKYSGLIKLHQGLGKLPLPTE